MNKIHSTILKRFGRDPKIIFARDGWKCIRDLLAKQREEMVDMLWDSKFPNGCKQLDDGHECFCADCAFRIKQYVISLVEKYNLEDK